MLLDRRGVRGHTGASGCLRFSLAIVVSCLSVCLPVVPVLPTSSLTLSGDGDEMSDHARHGAENRYGPL